MVGLGFTLYFIFCILSLGEVLHRLKELGFVV
jgi:hypothetical protein